MLKINNISAQNIIQKPAFKGDFASKPDKNAEKSSIGISNVYCNDSTVKAPIAYKYTGEIDVLGNHKAKTYMLANGQKVVILPKKGPTVVKTYVNVGSMNEPDNIRGVSHYIEHNLFNGTEKLKAGEFFNRVNNLGGSTNASTSFSTTDFYISSQLLKKGDLEEKIKLHSDMLQNPVFAPDMLEKERGPVISEISMVMDDPNNIAMNTAIKNLYQIKTKSPDLIAGTIDNIRNITREQVLDYYNTHYTPDNFTTVITGDVNPDEAITLVSKHFTKQNPIKPMEKKFETLTPINHSIRVDEKSDKAIASTVVLAFTGNENANSKDKVAVEALLSLLTGNNNARLTKALEAMHLEIDAGVEKIGNQPTDKKAILLMSKCSPEKVNDVINTIYKEIYAVQTGNISDKEFNIMKTKLISSIDDISESSAMLNSLIGGTLLDKDKNYLSNYVQILESLTKEDIQDAAKKYLDLNKTSIATVNPAKPSDRLQPAKISFGRRNDENEFLKKEVYDVSKLAHIRLPNNLEMAINPNNSNTTAFVLSMKCSTPAAVKPGVAEILSAMLNRGSIIHTKEEFFDIADTKGVDIGFSASPDEIYISAKTNSENSQQAVDLAKEVLLNPRLTQEDFEFTKEQIKELLQKAHKTANDGIPEELFPNLPYAASVNRILNNIDNITLEDVKGLYAYLMQNSHASFNACAPIHEKPHLGHLFYSKMSGMPVCKPFNTNLFQSFVPLTNSKIIAQIDERNQADVVKSYKFKTNGNLSDMAKFELLNIILGGNSNSRLFNDLREKQKLAYRVRSTLDFVGNTGIMSLSIKTTTDNPLEGDDKLDNLEKSLKGFSNNVDKIMSEYVSDEELESAKLYLKTRILDGVETSDGKTAAITKSKSTPYGINASNLFLEDIDKITKEDIKAAANYIFSNPSVTSIVASQKTLDHFKSNFK